MATSSLATPTTPGAASSSFKPLTLSSGPRPLQLGGNGQAVVSPPVASPTASLSRSNSTNTRNSISAGRRPYPKRLSSISYSVSPSSPSFGAIPELSNGVSAGAAGRPARSRPSSSSPSSSSRFDVPTTTPEITQSGSQTPTVLTLAEKHADLLRFIAAKESKCLELRTQLEQHEAELLVLKRKWERIVSKTKTRELGPGANGPSGGSGDLVAEALKGVGRYLGGLGLPEDPKVPSLSSSPSSASESPLARSSDLSMTSNSGPQETDVTPITPLNGAETWKKSHSLRHRRSRSPSPSSIGSPSTSTIPSARDSLSSISTSATSLDLAPRSSSEGDATPTEKIDPTPEESSKEAQAGLPWIPLPSGLNKKWEQIQRNTGLEKHSKRASLLLSDMTDMSTSLLDSLSAALSSPPPSQPKKQRPMSMVALSSSRPQLRTLTPTVSLLDGDDDGWMNSPSLSKPILPGTTLSPTTSTLSQRTDGSPKPAESTDAEDEWNW